MPIRQTAKSGGLALPIAYCLLPIALPIASYDTTSNYNSLTLSIPVVTFQSV